MAKLRCAVIGVGNMGQHHARVYSELAQLVAVCDLNEQQGKRIAKQYQARYYKTVVELLKHEKLDAVSVAVSTKHHFQVVKQTLAAGIPTLVEKPIASTVTEAETLLRLAKTTNTSLMVGHIERFNPVVQTLKEQLRKDVLGDLISLVAIRSGINPPQEKQSHVGLDLTIHDVDVCLFLLEQKPVSSAVYAQKITTDHKADSLNAILKFPSATATFSTNWLSPIKIRKLLLTGSKGYAELDYINQTLVVYNRPLIKRTSTYSELRQLSTLKPKKIRVPHQEPLKNELRFFLKHYDQPEKITPLTRDALTALKIVLQ